LHVMLALEGHTREGGPIGDEARRLLAGRSFANPMDTVFVIRLEADDPEKAEIERMQIVKTFAALGQGPDSVVALLVSPVMSGGLYQGWLDGASWEQVNQRSV